MGTKTRTNGSLTALLLLVCATLAAACSGPTPQATPATPTPLSVPAVPASSPLPTPLVAPTPTPVPAHFTPASATPTPARPPTPAATPSPPVLLLTHAGDGSGNLYIVEKRGRIRVA
ncbi:MAG: hypothetical protein EXR46_10230, partial [Dehalococcoidia bacterium]|nr:hypothetical protein [Dehalococcoidia bacterium]